MGLQPPVPQRTLGHLIPGQALNERQNKRPDLFVKQAYDVTGFGMAPVPGRHCP